MSTSDPGPPSGRPAPHRPDPAPAPPPATPGPTSRRGFVRAGLLALLVAAVLALIGGAVLWRSAGDVGYASGGDGSREEWLAAIPRQGEGYADGRRSEPDRCSLAGWFDDQLQAGMSSDEVVAAVGEPDDTETGEPPVDEVWRWELGLCSLDYDSYVVEFGDGRLVDLRYVQG